MAFSTTSDLAAAVCAAINADFSARFVQVERKPGQNNVSVTGTVGKPEEWRWLARRCIEVGQIEFAGETLRLIALGRSGKALNALQMSEDEHAQNLAKSAAWEAAEHNPM